MGTKTFDFRLKEPSLSIFQNHWFDTITPEEKNNRHISGKKDKHYCAYELETSVEGISVLLSLMVGFSLRLLDFFGFLPSFFKIR